MDYPALWGRLQSLLYLEVPDMASVIRWRTEQEQAHPPARRMSENAIRRFVAHYERLTIWMRETVPGTADLMGVLDGDHALADLVGAVP
jgi:D-glycerate 3-kinase